MNQIKAVILDVDGVIVGDKPGVNMPSPSKQVLAKLKELNSNGIPVILCTAKYYKAIEGVIREAGLDNLHIGDNGNVIFDPFVDEIHIQKKVDKDIAEELLKQFSPKENYWEVYKLDNVYVQKGTRPDLVKTHTEILQTSPVETEDLFSTLDDEIIKLIYIGKEQEIHDKMVEIDGVSTKQSLHPYIGSDILTIVSPQEISKLTGLKEIAMSLDIGLEDFLGVGDASSDWVFIQECGFKAAMENAQENLKTKVNESGGFVGGHVNEDGVLDIFKNFGLLS